MLPSRLQNLARWIVIALTPLVCGTASARETLHILTWPGYADPDVVKGFESANDVDVEVTIIGTDDELWARANANGGANFDVIAVNTAELQRYISQKLVQPMRGPVPNQRNQAARFRTPKEIPGLTRDGAVYGVPYTYSAMGLIYNRKLVTSPPTSMTAMWDPHYRGKVLAYNGSAHNFSFTALTLGIANPFDLGREDFAKVVQRLKELSANVFKFYERPEEVVEAFRENEIALAFGNYGDQQVQQLRKAGVDIGYVIPKEGALAWLDCWAVMRNASNRNLAEAWINYTLTPAVSNLLTTRQGLANTLADSAGETSVQPSDKLIWLQPVEDARRRAFFWERILAGFARARP